MRATGKHSGTPRLFVLVCYDIADKRRLRRVAKTMERWGERVQKSVFECELTAAQVARMCCEVKEILDPKRDSVRYYYLCRRCRAGRRADGNAQIALLPDVVVL